MKLIHSLKWRLVSIGVAFLLLIILPLIFKWNVWMTSIIFILAALAIFFSTKEYYHLLKKSLLEINLNYVYMFLLDACMIAACYGLLYFLGQLYNSIIPDTSLVTDSLGFETLLPGLALKVLSYFVLFLMIFLGVLSLFMLLSSKLVMGSKFDMSGYFKVLAINTLLFVTWIVLSLFSMKIFNEWIAPFALILITVLLLHLTLLVNYWFAKTLEFKKAWIMAFKSFRKFHIYFWTYLLAILFIAILGTPLYGLKYIPPIDTVYSIIVMVAVYLWLRFFIGKLMTHYE